MSLPLLLRRAFALALVAAAVGSVLGGLVHRDHAPADDAVCVVHAWAKAAATASVSRGPAVEVRLAVASHELPAVPVGRSATAATLRFARAPPA
jgi:hypothetical protein